VDGPSQPTSTAAAKGKSRAKGAKPPVKTVDPDEGDDDQPLVPKKRAARKPPKKKTKVQDSSAGAAEESEDDKPLVSTKKSSARGKRKVKVESDDDDDDAPLVKKPAATPKARGKAVKKEGGSDPEVPKPKKRGSKAKKEGDGEGETPKKGKKAKKEDDEDDEIHRWWDNENPAGDGTQKWQTLQHNGVYFPPPYEPLPSHVKMKYDGIGFCYLPSSTSC
jgi:DNA topoisomerase-1